MKSMFEALKQSLNTKNNSESGNGLYKEVLKFKAGNTYQVRLLMNPNAVKQSIFHYYQHIWNSNATGELITALCPTTFGEKCPIDAYYLKTYKSGSEMEKKASAPLSRKEGWLVNVYVISDPVNPENEGTVKILRYGKELARIITSALEGDDAADFGVEKVFDVNEGCTLRIKCESKSDRKSNKQYVTYASSRFLTPSSLDLDDEKVASLFESVHDLKSLYKVNTPAEMQRLLDEHFFNLTTGSKEEDSEDEEGEEEVTSSSSTQSDNDDVPWETETPKAAAKPVAVKAAPKKQEVVESDDSDDETDESTDEKLKKLLADL